MTSKQTRTLRRTDDAITRANDRLLIAQEELRKDLTNATAKWKVANARKNIAKIAAAVSVQRADEEEEIPSWPAPPPSSEDLSGESTDTDKYDEEKVAVHISLRNLEVAKDRINDTMAKYTKNPNAATQRRAAQAVETLENLKKNTTPTVLAQYNKKVATFDKIVKYHSKKDENETEEYETKEDNEDEMDEKHNESEDEFADINENSRGQNSKPSTTTNKKNVRIDLSDSETETDESSDDGDDPDEVAEELENLTVDSAQDYLLPHKRLRALILVVAEQSDIAEFTSRISLRKPFVRSFNTQLAIWVHSVISTIAFTTTQNEQGSKVACKGKTVTEEVIRDAIELTNPRLLKQKEGKLKAIFFTDTKQLQTLQYRVIARRLRESMKRHACNHRISKDALDLMQTAVFLRSFEVLRSLMHHMHQQDVTEFDVCPPF